MKGEKKDWLNDIRENVSRKIIIAAHAVWFMCKTSMHIFLIFMCTKVYTQTIFCVQQWKKNVCNYLYDKNKPAIFSKVMI